MLTRFIEELGFFIGHENDMSKNSEAFTFQSINEWLFYQKNVTWDNVENQRYISEDFARHMAKVVCSYISKGWNTRRFFGGRLGFLGKDLLKFEGKWGWKDPKTTINLDVWSKVFPDARIVHIYRNPVDVALSLKSREEKIGFKLKKGRPARRIARKLKKRYLFTQTMRLRSIREGCRLWEDYTRSAFDADNYFQEVYHLCYEDFLDTPAKKLYELAEYLNVEVSKELILSIAENVNKDRKYYFLRDKSQLKYLKEFNDRDLMAKCGYKELIEYGNK